MKLKPRFTSIRNRFAMFGLLLLGTCLLAGCGDKGDGLGGPPLYSISGKITLDGELVKAGSINFVPLDGRAKSSAVIKDGEYSITSGERIGHQGGKYQIHIKGFDGATNPVNMNMGFPLWAGSFREERDLEAADLENIDFEISSDDVPAAPERPDDPFEDT
jgi:hypothetical protein